MKRFVYILLCCLFCSTSSIGQIDTFFICDPGNTVELSAPIGQFAYKWGGDPGIDNPTIPNPIARPFFNSVYTLEMISSVDPINEIRNPDFEDGNQEFETDYVYNKLINFQGVYSVNESAFNLNPVYFDDCPDHTTGTGQMMVIDGSPVENQKVWCQTIAVVPGLDYAFTAWLASVHPNNPAELQFSINDENLGRIFKASNTVCQWRQYFEIWNAGLNDTATLCIINQNTNPNGNDFALDDFGFYEVEQSQTDTTVVIIEAFAAAKERRIYAPQAFSPNGDGVNDYFKLSAGKGVVSIEDLAIFNRWGNRIFHQSMCGVDDPKCRWNGTWKNTVLEQGHYQFAATVVYADQQRVPIGGGILLIRN